MYYYDFAHHQITKDHNHEPIDNDLFNIIIDEALQNNYHIEYFTLGDAYLKIEFEKRRRIFIRFMKQAIDITDMRSFNANMQYTEFTTVAALIEKYAI